jgi:hypothetical protein
MRTEGDREGGKFPNRSPSVTNEVYIKFVLVVFV